MNACLMHVCVNVYVSLHPSGSIYANTRVTYERVACAGRDNSIENARARL